MVELGGKGGGQHEEEVEGKREKKTKYECKQRHPPQWRKPTVA